MRLHKQTSFRAGSTTVFSRSKRSGKRLSLLAGAAAVMLTAHARAATDTDPQLLDFNFGGGNYGQTLVDYTGPAVVGSAGDVFNNFEAHDSNGSPLNVVDTAGNPTNVTVAFGGYSSYVTVLPTDGFLGTSYAPLMTSYLFGSNTVTLNDVTPGVYNLILLSENNQASDTGFTLNGVTLDANNPHDLPYTGTDGTNNTTGGSPSTFVGGVNYVEFRDVVVGPSGTLTFNYFNDSGIDTEAPIFNGFQLEAPEPSTFAMMLIGSAGLLVWQFRRRRA